MKELIELIKDDPLEFIGSMFVWSGLMFFGFMLFVVMG